MSFGTFPMKIKRVMIMANMGHVRADVIMNMVSPLQEAGFVVIIDFYIRNRFETCVMMNMYVMYVMASTESLHDIFIHVIIKKISIFDSRKT